MRVGLFSGSFNPVHLGHVALADWLVREGEVDEVWFVRTPLNPLKAASGLMPDADREAMLELAIAGHKGLRISRIEDDLPRPNYTVTTLRELQSRYPDHEFHLIIGADNWQVFTSWRNWETILRQWHVIVYPRPGYTADGPLPMADYPNVRLVQAPVSDISSTRIRQTLAEGGDISLMCDPKVADHLIHHVSTQDF